MTVLRDRWLPLSVLVLAIAALVASLVWVVGGTGVGGSVNGPGYGGMPMMSGHGGMMSGAPGHGPVRSLDDARRAADQFGQQRGLRTGEVMQFSNGYYAELLDSQSRGATEVLIDPASGFTQLEMGPAMMWNTAYGMTRTTPQSSPPSVTPDQALRIADQWLTQNRPGLHAADATAFPGYYTLHTLRDNQIVGMISVNAHASAAWYHTWHGQFVAMQEAATSGMPR
ncbi:hypothetical protein [Saccharomonospora cyanea]|uniref:Peptidase propeptide domain-containing protein n=1 Tax=Saccharomonospora cyanea NA-134 TaxID=882082 RepID=H5XDL3_9PSEU|nr:hypothetical protein [Saccharomonospora cyanea]EHR61334.1 hypothetical protein SaccyDRAFT_2463 [Saccharomonospora cyanea NA-134]